MTHDAWKYALEIILTLLALIAYPLQAIWRAIRTGRASHPSISPETTTSFMLAKSYGHFDADHIITLATALGSADAALIVWTFQRWMAENADAKSRHHFHKGRWWVYIRLGDLSEDHFPWLSTGQLARLITKLAESKVMIRQRYLINRDEANYWYSIDEEVLSQMIATNVKPVHSSRPISRHDDLPSGSMEDDLPSRPPRPLKGKRPPEFGYVYLMQATTGLYKIGMSRDAERRLKDFENLPFGVSCICVIETEDMRVMEAFVHARFDAKRVKGEWFDLDAEDVDYIRSLTLEGL